MVAAVAAPADEQTVSCDLAAVARLVTAGLDLLVSDAAKWLRDDGRLEGDRGERCRDAWDVLCCRPDGCPLVDLAAQLGDVDEWQVWESLWTATLELVSGG